MAKTSKAKKRIFKINAYFSALFLVGALLVINLISLKIFKRFDLSTSKRFTLSNKTTRFLETINDKIEIGAFFKKISPDYLRVKELLESYHTANPNITYSFIDVDKEPLKAKEFDNTSYNIIVIYNKTRDLKSRIFSINEENITNALIKLTRRNKKIIYFLKGHGERDILGRDSEGLYMLNKNLLDQGYLVKELYLPETQKIPDDITLLVVAGAKFELLDKEKQIIKDYIKNGGRALFLLEPPDSGYSFEGLLGDFGFLIKDNLIYDTSSKLLGGEPTLILVNSYGKHEITNDFTSATLFKGAREVNFKLMLPARMNTEILAQTGKYAFGESHYKAKPKFDPGEDDKGPLPIAAVNKIAIKVKEGEPQKDARIVVVGDTDFCSNYYFNTYGNKAFIMNIINWLAEEQDLISVSSVQRKNQLFLTGIQLRNLFYITVIIIPALAFLIGVFVFIKRRS